MAVNKAFNGFLGQLWLLQVGVVTDKDYWTALLPDDVAAFEAKVRSASLLLLKFCLLPKMQD